MTDKIKRCPVEAAFEHIGRKWAINIMRDLHMGKKKFREFLGANSKLSTKVLSQRLKELERDGLLKKRIVSKTPLRAEYELTEKGKALDKVLYELAMFSMKHYSREVFKQTPVEFDKKERSALIKKSLMMKSKILN